MNVREYLESGGNICLECGSKNIESGKSKFDADYCELSVDCNDCGAEWLDIYKLVGVEPK